VQRCGVRAVACLLASVGCVTGIDVAKPAEPVSVASPFTLAAQDGSTVTLAEVLAQDHVVLVFYRGHW
jgi:hypothetical protein